MKEFLQRTKLMTALTSILLIILGILLITNPTGAVLTVCRIVGCILFISGIVLIVMFLSRKGWETGSTWDVAMCVLGAVMLAVGVFIVIRPGAVVGFVGILFAIILFLHAIYDFREMLNLKRMNDERWWISLICAAVTFLMGILILMSPIAVPAIMTVLTGIFLIFDGLAELFIAFRVLQVGKRWEQEGFSDKKVIEGKAEEIDE